VTLDVGDNDGTLLRIGEGKGISQSTHKILIREEVFFSVLYYKTITKGIK